MQPHYKAVAYPRCAHILAVNNQDYICDRTLWHNTDKDSEIYAITAVATQESVIAPILWNIIYDKNFRPKVHVEVKIVGSTGDVALVVRAREVEVNQLLVNEEIWSINHWLKSVKLDLAVGSKLEVLNIQVGESAIFFKEALKYFEVMLDHRLNIKEHMEYTANGIHSWTDAKRRRPQAQSKNAHTASVAVSSWTLVAISCERYYAICHPLRSRTWQTINHAYKIIGCIWFGSIVCMAPIAIFSQLIPTSRQGLRKCREQWPKEAEGYERFYNILLDLVLLVLPLGILCIAYILITRTLYLGIKDEKALIYGNKNNNVVTTGGGGGPGGGGDGGGGIGTHSAGDVKVYTQVEADTKGKNIFNLNMSFRYHIRKSTGRGGAGSAGALGSSVDETLQIVQSSSSNHRENNIFTSMAADHNLKCLTTVSSYPKILCNNESNGSDVETHAMRTEAKQEENNKIQQHRQQQQQLSDKQYFISSSTSFQPDDDISHIEANEPVTPMETAFGSQPMHQKCTIVAKSSDGRRQQLSCMRSSSFKSFNRNSSRTSAGSEETITSSCLSLNAIPTKFQRQAKPHQASSLCTALSAQPQHVGRGTVHYTASDVGERRKLQCSPSFRVTESALRRSNLEKNLESKKRVVKMLFVLVLEFFICWTPLYVINTVAMFIGPAIYEYVDYTTISFFQLLAYSSSCCNPITYCFMNASFRRAFVDTFRGIHLNGGTLWHKSSKAATNLSVAGNSIAMGNSCTVVTATTVLDSPRL